MPSSPLRRKLRAAGHHLSPVVQVGKEGATEAVIQQLSEALDAHELVKVKVGAESPEDRFEVAERMGRDAPAQIAQVLGRTMLVYRRHPEKPRFEPPTAAERAGHPTPEAGPKRATRPWRRAERTSRTRGR